MKNRAIIIQVIYQLLIIQDYYWHNVALYEHKYESIAKKLPDPNASIS